ncbi:MAG: hypothetical protein AABW85_01810 [archaeon]
MRRLLFFRVGGRDVHMPKLIGAFVLFAALLYFIQASALMFNSWDNLKEVDSCLHDSGVDHFYCQDIAFKSTGLYVRVDQSALSMRQFWGVLLGPIANVLVWLAVLFIGWLIYKTGDLVLPIEESERVLPEKKGKKWAIRR